MLQTNQIEKVIVCFGGPSAMPLCLSFLEQPIARHVRCLLVVKPEFKDPTRHPKLQLVKCSRQRFLHCLGIIIPAIAIKSFALANKKANKKLRASSAAGPLLGLKDPPQYLFSNRTLCFQIAYGVVLPYEIRTFLCFDRACTFSSSSLSNK